MPDFGVSPLTGTIYMGKSKPLPNGKGSEWVGKKTDVTDGVLQAAFEWMHYQSQQTGTCAIKVRGLGVMSFAREEVGP